MIHVKYRDNETTTPVVVGATPDYSMANNHFVGYGRFVTETDLEHATPVDRDRRGRAAGAFCPRKTRWTSG